MGVCRVWRVPYLAPPHRTHPIPQNVPSPHHKHPATPLPLPIPCKQHFHNPTDIFLLGRLPGFGSLRNCMMSVPADVQPGHFHPPETRLIPIRESCWILSVQLPCHSKSKLGSHTSRQPYSPKYLPSLVQELAQSFRVGNFSDDSVAVLATKESFWENLNEAYSMTVAHTHNISL